MYPAQSFTEPRQKQNSCLKASQSLEGNRQHRICTPNGEREASSLLNLSRAPVLFVALTAWWLLQ